MEILKYTEAHRNFRERLRDFLAKEVTPHADQWEKDGIVPKEAWKKMGQAGFLCTEVSPDYGGIGGDFLYSVIVTEEISRTYQNGLVASLHSDIVVPYITSFGSDKIKKKYLPGCVSGDIISAVAMTEPDAGSDLAGIKTSAVEEGDEVIINGSKTFISNGIIADLVVLAARDPAAEDPYKAISLYLVEFGTPGFEKGRPPKKMGSRSQDTAELLFYKMPHTQRQPPGEKRRRVFNAHGKIAAGTSCLCYLGGCCCRAYPGMDHITLSKHPSIGKTHCKIPGNPIRFGRNGHRDKIGSKFCR